MSLVIVEILEIYLALTYILKCGGQGFMSLLNLGQVPVAQIMIITYGSVILHGVDKENPRCNCRRVGEYR